MKADHSKWCMCERINKVMRDGYSTCAQCGGRDAYKISPDRPGNAESVIHDQQDDRIVEEISSEFGKCEVTTNVPEGAETVSIPHIKVECQDCANLKREVRKMLRSWARLRPKHYWHPKYYRYADIHEKRMARVEAILKRKAT